jgi:hypothetical protein
VEEGQQGDLGEVGEEEEEEEDGEGEEGAGKEARAEEGVQVFVGEEVVDALGAGGWFGFCFVREIGIGWLGGRGGVVLGACVP